ncbi:hypothetical protein JCM33374_g3323 [Metschnikowia sp. JCM 33374]|nr:hypothetical protein JCM33374_g3323 [Metschnikowia sp. JCM 33374]
MKNGASTSRFKVECKHPNQFKHTPASVAARDPGAEIQKPDGIPLELSTTHHDSNCTRCYKLKKKCSRNYPSCDYCRRSNTPCEYIDRRKRRLRFEEVPVMSVNGDGAGPTRALSGLEGEGRNPILIASLVNHDEAETFRNIELPSSQGSSSTAGSFSAAGASSGGSFSAAPSFAGPSAAGPSSTAAGPSRTHSRMAPASMTRLKPSLSVSRNVISSSVVDRNSNSLHDEFLAVRPIADVSLPSAFVHTYFANYEWKYPFVSRHTFFKKLENLSFQNETLVGLDVYLVMAIGCIIYDANFNSQHYASYFSDSFVESIVDMISYDIKSEDDIHKAHLLILLSIYAINIGNTNLIWNIVGFLDRLIVFMSDFTGKGEACMRKRCFWTIFNLDKELSLVLGKPSQFIPTRIIKLTTDFAETLNPGESEKSAAFMTHSVMLHKLQDVMISYKLGLEPVDKEVLTKYSAEMEVWRVGISSLIHTEYAESSLLQNFIGLVNLDYYYLLIELDQLSSTESFQFTLQFLSNSFSLLLSDVSDKKESGGTSIYSLFWFLKFFKVVDYSVESLLRMLAAGENKNDLTTRLNDFNGNVQLEINLLKFLLNSKSRPQRFVGKLELYLSKLKTLNQKIVSFNPLVGKEKDIETLAKNIAELFERE